MLMNDRVVYEILFVLSIDDDYFLLCERYEIKPFDVSRNSLQIEISKEPQSTLFKIKELKSFQTYDKTYSDGKYFIISDTLNVFREF